MYEPARIPADEPDVQPTVQLSWPPVRYWAKTAGVILAMAVGLYLLGRLQGVLLVVLSSFVLALGLQPSIDWLVERGLKRWQAMAVVIVAGFLIAGAAAAAIVPVLITELDDIFAALPDLLDDLRAQGGVLAAAVDRVDWTAMLEGGAEGGGLLKSVTGMAGTVFNVVTVLIVTPYFAYSFPRIKRFWLRLLRREDRPEFLAMVNDSVDRIAGYIAGNLTVSAIAAAVSFVAFMLMDLPYPLALAFWIGITDLIPVVGVFLGAAPVLALASLDGTGMVIAAAAFIIIYQQIENYLIGPRVMKRAVDLSPPTVIVALMIGGSLAGFLGALLALPVAALIKVTIAEGLVARRVQEVRAANAATNGTGNGTGNGLLRRRSTARPLP